MLFTFLTIVLVVIVGAALLWFLGQFDMLDAGMMKIARAVIYLCVGLYVIFAIVGLLTGHSYVPVLRG